MIKAPLQCITYETIALGAIFFLASFAAISQKIRLAGGTKTSVLYLSVKDGKDKYPAIFYSVMDSNLQIVAVTDSIGTAKLAPGTTVSIRSYFYRDTVFVVPDQNRFSVILTPETRNLEEIEVTAYSIDKLVKLAANRFSDTYPVNPYLIHANAFSYIRDVDKFMEFYQMDGLALVSGNKKWSPWGFAPGGKPGAYFYLLPIEQRMSDRLDYDGSRIPHVSFDYENKRKVKWNVQPFTFRMIYRALEVCGPMFIKNTKYYDYAYGDDTDESYTVNFKTKRKYREGNYKEVLLVGEGKLYISKHSYTISRIEFELSGYNDVNFETNRAGRRRDVAGVLKVKFAHRGAVYPLALEYICHYLGNNWSLPRENAHEHNVTRYEKATFGTTSKVLLEDDEKKMAKYFAAVDIDSEAPYRPAFWQGVRSPGELLSEVAKNMSSADRSLEDQFRDNSGKRWGRPVGEEYLTRAFPGAKNIEEARKQYSDLLKSLREALRRNEYKHLK